MPSSVVLANPVSESLSLPELPAIEQQSDSLKLALPEINQNMDMNDNIVKDEQGNLDKASIGTRGSAPPLTELDVFAVISSQYPQYEFIAKNQVRTIQDHGGAELYIVTKEIGYGSTRFAKINGSLLQCVKSQYIDNNGDHIIDGRYYWWDASGYQDGTFTYQNTSNNYPYNTMSDWIDIR